MFGARAHPVARWLGSRNGESGKAGSRFRLRHRQLDESVFGCFPETEVYGIDFDPVLLPLAQQRLRPYQTRARLILADLRSEDWRAQVPASVDAVISATALHWLTEVQLANLYRQLSALLRSGGLSSTPTMLPVSSRKCKSSGSRTGMRCDGRRQSMTARIGMVFGKRMRGHRAFRATADYRACDGRVGWRS